MMATKIIAVVCIGLAVFMCVPIGTAQAREVFVNPLLIPFAVAGAAVGAGAAIATAPFQPFVVEDNAPAYSGPPPTETVWIPGHYTPDGAYIPGHYRPAARVWIPGHYTSDGAWDPGHFSYD